MNEVTVHTGPVFAHASGFSWDEALMVLVPILLIAAVLFLANSRAKKLGVPTEAAEPAEPAASVAADRSDPAEGSGPASEGSMLRADEPRAGERS